MSLSQYDSSDTSEVFKDTQENLDADEVIEKRSKYYSHAAEGLKVNY